MPALLHVENLSVSFTTDERKIQAVREVSFDINKGEIVGIVGESGSGKTVTGMSLLRLIPSPPGHIESGKVLFKGQDLLEIPIKELCKIRGKDISVIFQEPMTALSPLHRIGHQLAETLIIHEEIDFKQAWEVGIEWLEKVGIPDPKERMKAYPFQFSGGMQQRVMIAMALMLNPSLIIADEPTTALDVTIQAQIFELLLKLKNHDTSILFITHDMGVIWELSDRVLVMKDARIVEEGTIEDIFHRPEVTYTQNLLAAVPQLTDESQKHIHGSQKEKNSGLIRLKNLRTWFPIRHGIWARTVGHVKAVDDVSLSIRKGETFGLVGESGSGKTTLGRTILGLERAWEGAVYFKEQNITQITHKNMKPLRRHLQMIFQDPYSSLNPRMTVLDILTEGLIVHNMLESPKKDTAAKLLEEVGLQSDHMFRYPHEFSGGQRQRICIARVMALRPEFVVCDEAVSALDVTVQAQIIEILLQLQEKYNVSYLFISHDLSVVKQITDQVAVMRNGKVVEEGNTQQVIDDPKHPYTQTLINAVPLIGGKKKVI
ncbi:MAG: dipeptide ABC transporter ATP-binding protein [Kiritimatiellae bacterium]|nr:dipeptide ABC transporter ATP-binding protein [Kiritimatiellia bacterium]